MIRLNTSDAALLLALESACVDNKCVIAESRLTSEDIQTAENWNTTKFIQFGRQGTVYRFRDDGYPHSELHYFVYLGDEAWKLAAYLRESRAAYSWLHRTHPTQNGNDAN